MKLISKYGAVVREVSCQQLVEDACYRHEGGELENLYHAVEALKGMISRMLATEKFTVREVLEITEACYTYTEVPAEEG